MKYNNKKWIVISAILLFAVSVYRQLCIRYDSENQLYPFVVYAVYLFLLVLWYVSIKRRLMQSTMRRLLYYENYIMVFWMTVRFLQEEYFYKDMHIMRMSGYLISIPLMMIPLLGFYAAFGLGCDENYTMPRKWLPLSIPVVISILLILTSEYTGVIIKVYPDEEENLYFHATYGVILPILLDVFLIVGRIMIIYRKTRRIKVNRHIKLLPLALGIAMPLTLLVYLIQGFVSTHEIIELSAKLFFLEALSWEMCIIIGLIPVNTNYVMVFEQSTAGMRITDQNGNTLVSSSHSRVISRNQFNDLCRQGVIVTDEGQELHLHKLKKGYLIYQKDVSQLRIVMGELNKTAEELKQESVLLNEELKTRSEETRIQVQNQIYNDLTNEVGFQLELMKSLLRDRNRFSRDELFKRLCIIGTYIKRRCNLRLIEQTNGCLDTEDLWLSIKDLASVLEQTGVNVSFSWQQDTTYPPELSLFIFDVIELIIESCDFRPESIKMQGGGNFRIRIRTAAECPELPDTAYFIEKRCISGGYEIMIREEEGRYAVKK